MSWVRSAGGRVSGTTAWDAVVFATQSRITALAAQASFWGIFALPWLFLALVAGIAQLDGLVGIDALPRFRAEVLQLADEVLTAEAIDELLVPLLDGVLERGRAGVGLLGLLVAVWSGSRVIDALVGGMTIVYQREGLRSFVKSRVVSLTVYLGGIVGLVVAIPVVVAGPSAIERLVPGVQGFVTSALLVGAEILVVVVMLVSLYHWSVPHRTRWVADLPGALIAMALWVVLSFGLRWYFVWLFRDGSVYGVVSAPIAVMLWVYVTCLALLLGAAFNGALAVRRGWFTVPDDTAADLVAVGHTDPVEPPDPPMGGRRGEERGT